MAFRKKTFDGVSLRGRERGIVARFIDVGLVIAAAYLVFEMLLGTIGYLAS